MNVSKLAEQYALAAIGTVDQYDTNFRNTVLNQPVMQGAIPFKDTAEMVIEHLNSIDPEGANPNIKTTTHALMDIVNNHEVPTAQQLLNSSNTAYSLVSTTAPNNKDALNTAKYLSNLAKIITYKYYREGMPQKGNSETQSNSEEQQNRPAFNNEPLWKVLSRSYQSLRGGKQLAPNDLQRLQSEKANLSTRLNVLNTMKTRSPAQEQERNVLNFVSRRLG